jgi:hypothetical protein
VAKHFNYKKTKKIETLMQEGKVSYQQNIEKTVFF